MKMDNIISPSNALRYNLKKSYSSSNARFVDTPIGFDNYEVPELSLRARVCAKLTAQPGVRIVWPGDLSICWQFPPLLWFDAFGVPHTMMCDYVAAFDDGTLMAVKVGTDDDRPALEDIIKRVKAEGFAECADYLVLMTERDVEPNSPTRRMDRERHRRNSQHCSPSVAS